jgi:hypothetical protein
MGELKNLKVSFLTVNAPSSWPSAGLVSKELRKSIEAIFPQIKDCKILETKKPSITDDLWIIPMGIAHTHTLHWLKTNFKSPYHRPRILFFLGGEGAKLCYNLYFFKDLFRLEDEWIVASHVEKKLLDNFFKNNNRTHVLFYPISKNFIPLKPAVEKKSLRKKLNLPQSKKIILYAGRISLQKNVLYLLDILEKFNDLHLIICGDVDSLGLPHFNSGAKVHLPTLLLEELSRRKLSERIEFRNFLSQEDLKKVMQACDYQVSLSAHYGEDFGYSIAQGLGCGLKTILSHWGGHTNWKDYFNSQELTYVELDWKKDPSMGVPVLKNLLKLPINSKINFSLEYKKAFKEKFQKIISNSDFKNRSVQLIASESLKKYWDEIQKKPRDSMFLDSKDDAFKVVVDTYLGN